jgi:rhodanese-related sulfurtransferase
MTSSDGPPPAQDGLVRHFASKLAFETDATDVRADMVAGRRFVLVDVRSDAAWRQGRIQGAVHLPAGRIAADAPGEIPLGTPVVTYCWGPGCNGATRGALAFAQLGYRVREMIGGFEYWAREGLPIENDSGVIPFATDRLTAPEPAAACGC